MVHVSIMHSKSTTVFYWHVLLRLLQSRGHIAYLVDLSLACTVLDKGSKAPTIPAQGLTALQTP